MEKDERSTDGYERRGKRKENERSTGAKEPKEHEKRKEERAAYFTYRFEISRGRWAHGLHGPTKTHPCCRTNVLALLVCTVGPAVPFCSHDVHLCCSHRSGDLGVPGLDKFLRCIPGNFSCL